MLLISQAVTFPAFSFNLPRVAIELLNEAGATLNGVSLMALANGVSLGSFHETKLSVESCGLI